MISIETITAAKAVAVDALRRVGHDSFDVASSRTSDTWHKLYKLRDAVADAPDGVKIAFKAAYDASDEAMSAVNRARGPAHTYYINGFASARMMCVDTAWGPGQSTAVAAAEAAVAAIDDLLTELGRVS